MGEVKQWNDAWDRTEKGCGPIFLSFIIILFFLFSCNDGGTPTHVIVDSTKPIDTIKLPDGKDSVVYENRLEMAMGLLSKTNEIDARQDFAYITGLGNDYDENSDIVNRFIDSVAPNSNVVFPRGEFGFSKTILLKKSLQIYGAGTNATILHFKGVTGIYLYVSISESYVVKDLMIIGDKSPDQNGLEIHARANVENVEIRYCGNDGVHISSAVPISNSGMSSFRNVYVKECKGNGFDMWGQDSNGMAFYNCNVMDNGEAGFYDHSFLGNTFFACMGHNNKPNYVMNGPVNRATLLGCYSENGPVKDYIGGRAYVFGGTWGENGQSIEMHDGAKVYNQ